MFVKEFGEMRSSNLMNRNDLDALTPFDSLRMSSLNPNCGIINAHKGTNSG